MGRESDSRLFSHGNDFGKEVGQTLPHLFGSHRSNRPRRRRRVVCHVPDLSARDRRFIRSFLAKETNRLGFPPGEMALHMPPDSCNAEVVAENRNPRFP